MQKFVAHNVAESRYTVKFVVVAAHNVSKRRHHI